MTSVPPEARSTSMPVAMKIAVVSRGRAAGQQHRRADRRCAPRRRRRVVADPGGRGAAGARARRRAALCLAARQPAAELLHRRRARIVRLRRPGPDRRVLSVRRPDRRRGQYQPCEHRRLRASEGALPRLVRLGLSLLCGAEGDPVPPRAHAPHLGGEGRFHQRAGSERGQRLSSRRPVRAHHQSLPVRVRPRATALHARQRASRAHRRRGRSRIPASPSTRARRCRRRQPPRARICASCERRWRRSWSRSIPSSPPMCSGCDKLPDTWPASRRPRCRPRARHDPVATSRRRGGATGATSDSSVPYWMPACAGTTPSDLQA